MSLSTNEDYTLYIDSQSGRNGVGRIEGMAVFVDGAVAGDTLLVRLSKIKRTHAFGVIRKVLSPSAMRAEPHCTLCRRCGGCPFGQIAYRSQLELKTRQVKDALLHIGSIDADVSPCIGMEDPLRYRNKMVFPVSRRGDDVVFGFYAPKSHDVIPMRDCPLGPTEAGRAAGALCRYMNEYGFEPYDELTGTGLVRRLFWRRGFSSGESMAVVVCAGRSVPHPDELVSALRRADKGLRSVILNIHEGRSNRVLGSENVTLWGKPSISERLCSFDFDISPLSFFQVNPVQTERLYDVALGFADIKEGERVLDLYCGIGTISLCAARRAAHVTGVEIVEDAIENARINARSNGVSNASFIAGDAPQVIGSLTEKNEKCDVVILDPPRAGSDEKTLSCVASMRPRRIVYVSCNPATLARDVKFLLPFGYAPERIQPIDMFPFTEHVETVCLLTHNRNACRPHIKP